MLFKTTISILLISIGGAICGYSDHVSKLPGFCSKYIDLVRSENDTWNSKALEQNSFYTWGNRYDETIRKLLKSEEINGYEVLVPNGQFVSHQFYRKDNKIKNQGRFNLFEFLFKEIINPNSKSTTWWAAYLSAFQLINEFSSFDCKDLEYAEWLKLTEFFEIFPISLTPGFQNMEILLDDEAKIILAISYIEDRGEGFYDGLVLSLEGDSIFHLTISNKDKDSVIASLVETAIVMKQKTELTRTPIIREALIRTSPEIGS